MSEIQGAGAEVRHPGAPIGRFRQHASHAKPWLLPVDAIAETADEFENPFEIRIVNNASRDTASNLLQRRYAWRGYSTAPLERDADGRMTLSACVEEATVATITAALDSEEGLFVSRLYPDEVQALRNQGRKLCEFTKLAVDESIRSHTVLGAIFHVAMMYVFNLHRCDDVLIEVNPRHVRFYERMLGFHAVAGERFDPSVQAPAVLLRLDLAHCAHESERLGGRRKLGSGERSFYPYFFAPGEAARIVDRLRTH